ncbi:MAG TPA: sterol carrier protein domain-containing protein [Dehalococcoidia bacterium]|nr:sterol carrier protein domain-containing protein [Dehalococcoidia bacterium]
MTREIRHLRSGDEMARYAALRAYACNDDRGNEALARFPAMYRRDWCMGVCDDGALAGALAVIPSEQYITSPRNLWFGIMLRIVGVERAVAARPALPQSHGRHNIIELVDAAAPWNAGRWRISAKAGCMSAERTSVEPEIVTDACGRAAMYNGYLAPADAARCGAVEVPIRDAVARLSGLFSVSAPPCCADEF